MKLHDYSVFGDIGQVPCCPYSDAYNCAENRNPEQILRDLPARLLTADILSVDRYLSIG